MHLHQFIRDLLINFKDKMKGGLPKALYSVTKPSGTFVPSELCRGPWSPDLQHAGPPVALLSQRVMQEAQPLGYDFINRMTANILRPVPLKSVSGEF